MSAHLLIAEITSKILCVIPARGGSSRVSMKNIRLLGDKPLLLHTVDAVRESGLGLLGVVSTDCPEIAAVAERGGVMVLNRPAELATPTASTEGVLLHALDHFEQAGRRFDWVMTLPPTSPFRSGATICQFVEELALRPDTQDCLMSVQENRGDFWFKNLDGTIRRLLPNAPRRQQEREPLLEENSSIYISSVRALRETNSVLGLVVRGIVIDPIEAWDINVPFDFELAEAILKLREKTHDNVP